MRSEFNSWEKHLMGQPLLQDFIPRAGPVTEEHIAAFMACLQDWLVDEAKLRAIWRKQ